jgi:hypothetical protein
MEWNATISVKSSHFTFRQTSVLRNQIITSFLKWKNFGDSIFFKTPDTLNFMFLVCAMQWVVTLKTTGIFEGEENGFQMELWALSIHKWNLYGKTPYPTTVGCGSFDPPPQKKKPYPTMAGYGSKCVEKFLTQVTCSVSGLCNMLFLQDN